MHAEGMALSDRKRKETIDSVIALLNALDPYGLDPGDPEGAPWKEYRNEAGPMASLLLNDATISREQVDNIWQDWFDESLSDTVGPREAERFTSRLNLLVKPANPTAHDR
jgi:hypothetical protein